MGKATVAIIANEEKSCQLKKNFFYTVVQNSQNKVRIFVDGELLSETDVKTADGL